MQKTQKLFLVLLTSSMLLTCLSSQLIKSTLPKLKMTDFTSPNYISEVDLSDENKFLLTRTILNPNECQLTLYYEFETEGLVSLIDPKKDKNDWSSAKYVAPGNPLLLFTRRIELTLKKETFYADLCREGDWKQQKGLSQILTTLNVLDWDLGYLKLWKMKSYSPFFLKLSTSGSLNLDKMNLDLINESLFKTNDKSLINFELPQVQRDEFAKQLLSILEESLKESFRALYKLNNETDNRVEILQESSMPRKFFENLMPFVSRFFGISMESENKPVVTRVNMMNLKMDIDHIVNMMKSELLNRDDLYHKSQQIHKNHHNIFMPMTNNKLFVFTQMIWKIQDMDPYFKVNHLLKPQLNDLITALKNPSVNPDKFKLMFAEIFMVYYTQMVSGFDSIGSQSAYTEFITQYLTDIFNRIKLDMDGLMGLVTKKKSRLMSRVQSCIIKAYNFLKSSEPILLPNMARFVKSAEILGDRFLKAYQSASENEKEKFIASIDLLRNMDKSSRNVLRVKFNPFDLAAKKNVLL